MVHLTITHKTSYRYREPVQLSPHRLMLRPRESRDLKIVSSAMEISPDATVTWGHDVAGNAVATATFPFTSMTDRLVITCSTEVEHSAAAWPVFDIAASAISFPFRYSDEDWTDLGALSVMQHPDPGGRLAAWAQGFVWGRPTDTLSLLQDLSAGVAGALAYETRDDEGTQSPLESLDRAAGSCRDFAVLFAEAVRSLGFGARLVSGYLYDPGERLLGSQGAGTTHAWAEVYVPGAGWIPFDPTNRSMGGANLVPVAVVRDIVQAVPVSGSYVGKPDAFADMTVTVEVSGGSEDDEGGPTEVGAGERAGLAETERTEPSRTSDDTA
ncbi:transglutaminase family protein [Rubellimicrobium rubrum]|uniref:Transglutaminase family protein n=1 Tax=Rubellimicrobium rubrum TaxID=2585369 RepID=A0A5C4MYL6_9RHOB|nr:transglutaminase family protein [Rubellimicrobium rubrum]TNC49195.1 transglutaminase family protein [Rubellimicrobium rubrum]